MSLRSWTTGLARNPRAPLYIVAAGVLLTASSLGSGFSMDDHLIRATVRGESGITRPAHDLFHFLSDDPVEHAATLDRGLWPWFTSPALKARFFRPVSSLSAQLDYSVLPDWPWLFHLESVALYAALIALVLALYREVLPRPALALLGALLFAIDDAHGWTVGWLANRNALFAAVFGMAAVVLHVRAVRHRFRPGWVLGPVSLALAFASGEAAVGAFGYLVAFAAAFDDSPLRRRLASLTPHLLVVVVWAVLRRWKGYGVSGSGMYLDPVNEPVQFLLTFPSRALSLLLSQFALPIADVWGFFPENGSRVLVPLALGILGVVGWVLARIVRQDRGARFLALGTLFAVVPVTGAEASDRNLLLVGVGAFGLIASVIGEAAEHRTRTATWVRRGFIGVHCVLAPLLLPVTSVAFGLLGAATEESMRGVTLGPEATQQTVVLVNSPMTLISGLYWAIPRERLPNPPGRVRTLATTDTFVRVRREDERTLLLMPAPGIGSASFDAVFRGPGDPLRVGERVELPGTTFEVLEPGDPQPRAFRARFSVPLEDPSLRWFAWDGTGGGRFAPFELPAVGAELVVGKQ